MASRTVTAGLQRWIKQMFQTTGYSAVRHVQTLSVDGSAFAFAAGDTALNSGGGVLDEFDVAFNVTPTFSGSVVTMSAIIPAASGNFTIRRIAVHDDTAANVSISSATLVAGIDAQSLTKTSDFTVTLTLECTLANV